MKNILLILSLLFTIQIMSFGQEQKRSNRERVESMRVAFITSELDLSPTEAQQFWPVFNEMSTEIKALKKKYRLEKQQVSNDMSDSEAEQFVQNYFEREEKMVALEKEYFTKFREVIPIQKIVKLKVIDREFKQQLLTRMKERKGRDRQEK